MTVVATGKSASGWKDSFAKYRVPQVKIVREIKPLFSIAQYLEEGGSSIHFEAECKEITARK